MGPNAVTRYFAAMSRGDPVALIGTGAFVVLVLAALLVHRWRQEQKRRHWHGRP